MPQVNQAAPWAVIGCHEVITPTLQQPGGTFGLFAGGVDNLRVGARVIAVVDYLKLRLSPLPLSAALAAVTWQPTTGHLVDPHVQPREAVVNRADSFRVMLRDAVETRHGLDAIVFPRVVAE